MVYRHYLHISEPVFGVCKDILVDVSTKYKFRKQKGGSLEPPFIFIYTLVNKYRVAPSLRGACSLGDEAIYELTSPSTTKPAAACPRGQLHKSYFRSKPAPSGT